MEYPNRLLNFLRLSNLWEIINSPVKAKCAMELRLTHKRELKLENYLQF